MNNETENFIPVDKMSYREAVTELDGIVRRMQDDRIDIDLLATYTRRAAELLTSCRARLTATEEDLRGVLDSIKSTDTSTESSSDNFPI